MKEHEYIAHDAIGLGELVRKKEISPREVVDLAIARIDRLNPSLNAVVHTMADLARRGAEASTGAGVFAGVPFLIKDLLAWYAGEPITSGSRLYRDFRPPIDTEVVRRYKAAGCLIAGKTNTPEFGLTPFCESRHLGIARNPWDPSRTTGGSSGGSGAAVGSRMVPMASGGDGGGSIRIPASCNGVFGLKPTRGRTPTGPRQGELWHGAAIEHVITRTVRDSAAMLDAIAGMDAGAPYGAPAPERPFLSEVARPVEGLRVGVTTTPLLGHEVHADCVAAVNDARRLLESLGHETVDVTVPVQREAFNRNFVILICGEVAAELADAERLLGRRPRRDELEYTTWGLSVIGRSLSASDYALAARDLQRACRPVGQLFETIDVLLTPTLASPPIPHGALQPPAHERHLLTTFGALRAGRLMRLIGAVEKTAEKIFDWIPYTPLFNVSGQPAMSVPLWWNAEGLPVGVQIVGRYGDEATLFRLAAQLENARPWADRMPAMARPA
ncbi:MAG: amidase [Gemmatimonadaceae bacterium]